MEDDFTDYRAPTSVDQMPGVLRHDPPALQGNRRERRQALRKADIRASRILEINSRHIEAFVQAIRVHWEPRQNMDNQERQALARTAECRSEASFNALRNGRPLPPPPPLNSANDDPQTEQATPPSPNTAPPSNTTGDENTRASTVTIMSANMAGFAPKKNDHATNRDALATSTQNAQGEMPDTATLLLDYTLTAKHEVVLECMRGSTTVVMIQEYHGSQESADALLTHMQNCGVGGFISLAPRTDKAAGVTFLWRNDVWTLLEPPTVHARGRAATVHLHSEIDGLSYKFTNVYAPQRGLSADIKREFSRKLVDGLAAIAHTRPHFISGDFNAPPQEFCRNSTIDPNTTTLARMEELCKLTRISPDHDSFFWANEKETKLSEIDWPYAKDEAAKERSVPSLNPKEKTATIHSIADGKRFVLLPASLIDNHFAQRDHPTKTATLFATLQPYDSNDRHDDQADPADNGELYLLIEPVVESMPEGMVLRREKIQWCELYPNEPLTPEDDKNLIRVLRKNFSPFSQKFCTEQTIDLNALHGVPEDDDNTDPAPPRAKQALDTNMRHRNITPKSGSTCLDHMYVNDAAKHMTNKCVRGAPIGKKLKNNSTYHLTTYATFNLSPKDSTPPNAQTQAKKRLKLHEVTTKLGGWEKMQGRIISMINFTIGSLANEIRNDPTGHAARKAAAELSPDTPPDVRTSAHGHTPQSLMSAAEEFLTRTINESNAFTDDMKEASANLPIRPNTGKLIESIRTIGGIQTINAVFEGAHKAVADALQADKDDNTNNGNSSNPHIHKSLVQRTKARMDTYIQIRGHITLIKKQADTRRADPTQKPSLRIVRYMQQPRSSTMYDHHLVPAPDAIHKMWNAATTAHSGAPTQITYQDVYERTVQEETILTNEISALHVQMWATIDEDRAKSQARRLQEILDENEHRNFVVTLWQHWRDVEDKQLITPRRLPLPRVLDTELPDAPPIAASDPQYTHTVKRELERLWEEKPTMKKAINKLVELTGVRDDAIPTPHYLDAIAECTVPSNVRKSVNKIRPNAATGPDNVHGYCARKGGEPVVAMLQVAATLALLTDNADLEQKRANLALVHKAGRDPNNAAASHRPLVVFNHVQVFLERLLQWLYNKHVEAVRSDSQAAFLPNRTTPAINWIQRLSAELAMFAGEERTEASSDAQSFYDKIQLVLQILVEQDIGIPTSISERVRHTTASTSLSTRTEGGIVEDIAVRSGAGQGRALATAKSQLVLILRERLAAQTAPGEQFHGHQMTHVQHANRAFADDESTSMRGPLSSMLAELAQEASVLAADLVLGCPNNPSKSIQSNSTRDADNNAVHSRDYPIVLPNGPDRTPVPMEFTEKPCKTVGIYTANGIEHAATDNSRTLTIGVFNKKATSQGGLLFPEIKEARKIISLGTNCFKLRPTIAQIENSHSIDRSALREDVAAGFVHHSVKQCTRHAPAEAYGAGVPNDEATARAALVDDLLRTLNLPPGVPWRDAMEAYLTKYLWLCGNNEGAPLAFTPPTTRRADAEKLIGPYFYESLEMAGLMLLPSYAPTRSALDPDRAPTREPHLDNATQLWHGIDIHDTHITTSQRLISLGIRYVEDLIEDVVNESSPDGEPSSGPHNRTCTLLTSHKAETAFGGSAHGNAPVVFSTADHKAFDQLKRELLTSRTAMQTLRNYAASHTEPPTHIKLALAMNAHIGQRPAIIDAYREARPDGAAKTRGVSAETGCDGRWAPTRTADTPMHATCRAQTDSMPRYLVRTAGNLMCGSEGRWLTHSEVLQHAENAITALINLEPTMNPQAIRDTIMEMVETAMVIANEKHTIPGPFYEDAAVNMTDENHADGNIWQRLNDASPGKADKITCGLIEHFQAYALRKGQPRTTESNGSQTSRTRRTRNHPVPDYQTYARGSRNSHGKQIVGPQSSEADSEANLHRFDRMDRNELLAHEEQAARAEKRMPLQRLLSSSEDRFFSSDTDGSPNPFYSNSDTKHNPITKALTRDRRVEPTGTAAPPFWQIQNTNAISSTNDPFRVDVDPSELAGATPAADKELAMVLLAIQHTIGELHLIRFTDGALFPDPNEPSKAQYVGWGMVRAATSPGTRLDNEPKYTGNALTPLATIGRAELSAVIHAMLDLKHFSDDRAEHTQTGAANMVICMDSDGCAVEIENTLRAGDHESLTKCDDAQLIETIDNLRADLHRAGCKVVIVKVPGHAKPEYDIEAVTMQSYADATAKAAAMLPRYTDPTLVITRGPFMLAAQDAPNHANTNPNDGYSTIGTGTRMVKTATQKLQNCLTLRAVRADDATHDAESGLSAIDRVLIGADPKHTPTTSTHTAPTARDAKKRNPPCTTKTHSASSPYTMSLHLPRDTNVWRDLIRDMCGGHNVRKPPDCKPGGYAWLHQALGQGSITYRCKQCPACGQRADARHIITNECPFFKIPENVRDMLRDLLCVKVGAETLMLQHVTDPEAQGMTSIIQETAHTLFGDTPPQRDENGWRKYTRALRAIAGGLPDPSNALLKQIKEKHDAEFDSHRPAQPNNPTLPAGAIPLKPPRKKQPAAMHGRIAPDKLNSMRNDFVTTALQAANLTKPPPHTAPPPTPTNEQEAEKKFDHDDHFFIPRRPDNATNAYVRNRVMNDLRYIWEILAKMLNEYEQALNIAADDYDKHDRGKGNDVDEDENYKRGKAAREKDDPTVERSARLENRQIEKETRATAPPQSKTPKANPMRDYRTAGFGERRFKGGPAIDVDAEKKLTEANEKGTDGLARNNDTTAILTALARHDDRCASIQLMIQARPGPPGNTPRPAPLPRHPPSQYAEPAVEAELHQEQQSDMQQPGHKATFARDVPYRWNLNEMTALNAHWRPHNLANTHWCPDIISRTNAPTVAANQQTSDDVDPQQPDAADVVLRVKDKCDADTDSDEEIDAIVQSSPVTASADAGPSQHEPAEDADDEQDMTQTPNPEPADLEPKKKPNKRGKRKQMPNQWRRISNALKRTDQQPEGPTWEFNPESGALGVARCPSGALSGALIRASSGTVWSRDLQASRGQWLSPFVPDRRAKPSRC